MTRLRTGRNRVSTTRTKIFRASREHLVSLYEKVQNGNTRKAINALLHSPLYGDTRRSI